MLRLQRLSEKWSALYQSRLSEKSSQEKNAPPTLKDRINEFLQVDGRLASVSRDLKEQIKGLRNALTRQAEEIGEVVAAIKVRRTQSHKQPRSMQVTSILSGLYPRHQHRLFNIGQIARHPRQ